MIPLAGWLILTAPTDDIPTLTDAPPPSLLPEEVACSVQNQESLLRAVEAAEAAIEAAHATANQNICDEAEARLNGTSESALERKAAEDDIKKLYEI